MAVDTTQKVTGRFVDWSPIIAMGAAGVVMVAGILSGTSRTTLANTTVNAVPDQSVNLDPIQIAPRSMGALRVDVAAQLPSNRWVSYEVLLMDASGNVLGSAVKQSWRESGTWAEGGESGTWSDSDLNGGVDVRATAGEMITVAILVLGYGDTKGNTLTDAVPFQVTVKNGVIDGRYLWVGFLSTLALAGISFLSAEQSGKPVITRSVGDSDIGGRAVVGGKDSLIKVRITTTTDETSPRQFRVDLMLKDENGEVLYEHGFPLQRQYRSEDVYRQTLTTYFVLRRRASCGFYVEVVPDGPVDSTRLVVYDQTKVRKPVNVIYVENI